MSDNPWETPRHDRPMTHAPVNPTQPYVPPAMGGGGDAGWSGAGFAYSGGVPASAGLPVRKSLWLAIPLTLILGPFGLFYIGILSGVVGIIVVPMAVRAVAFGAALSSGGGLGRVEILGILTAWLICVPWAVIGVKLRNAKIDRMR